VRKPNFGLACYGGCNASRFDLSSFFSDIRSRHRIGGVNLREVIYLTLLQFRSSAQIRSHIPAKMWTDDHTALSPDDS
jgi:hypothetical protein